MVRSPTWQTEGTASSSPQWHRRRSEEGCRFSGQWHPSYVDDQRKRKSATSDTNDSQGAHQRHSFNLAPGRPIVPSPSEEDNQSSWLFAAYGDFCMPSKIMFPARTQSLVPRLLAHYILDGSECRGSAKAQQQGNNRSEGRHCLLC